MKIKTSCEIATIAALVHFGKNPEDGLAWIEEIYNVARREAAANTAPVNLDPIIDKAIDLGQAVERDRKTRIVQKLHKARKQRKSAEIQGGALKSRKKSKVAARRIPQN